MSGSDSDSNFESADEGSSSDNEDSGNSVRNTQKHKVSAEINNDQVVNVVTADGDGGLAEHSKNVLETSSDDSKSVDQGTAEELCEAVMLIPDRTDVIRESMPDDDVSTNEELHGNDWKSQNFDAGHRVPQEEISDPSNSGWDLEDDVIIEEDSISPTTVDVTVRCNEETLANSVPVVSDIASSSGKGVDQRVSSDERDVTPTRRLESKTGGITERSVFDRLSDASESSQMQRGSSWGWSGWGSSLLSSASLSVATFTNQFEQGLNTVLETVESTLGAPPPEKLAAEHAKDESQQSPDETRNYSDGSRKSDSTSVQQASVIESSIDTLVSGVSSLTSVFESKVITGGLDTLELIGRKTMDMLQEGDPGLKKKRAFIHGGKQSLSEALREAKEKAEECSTISADDHGTKQIYYGTVFDDHQGFVHLEALEMLSKQCEQKLQFSLLDLTGETLQDVQQRLADIDGCCTLESVDDSITVDENTDSDFAEVVTSCLEGINDVLKVDKLLKAHLDTKIWLCNCIEEQDKGVAKEAQEIYGEAITFLGRFTAMTIEVLHKACELIMVASEGDISEKIIHLSGFGNACCLEISIQSSRFSFCLNTAADDSESPDLITPLITNVYLEASNSNTYIQDAFQLIVPIIQLKYLQDN